MDYKIFFGSLTIIIALVSYSFYFHDIFVGKTKPHAFSWFVWSVLSGIVFFAQIIDNAGPGAWITGFTAVVCFVISVISSFVSSSNFRFLDWMSLVVAFIAIIWWRLTQDPAVAVILICVAYSAGFLPTFKKGFVEPGQETAITFALNAGKFFIAIFALSSFSATTLLYPLTLVVLNGSFASLLFFRRRNLEAKK